MEARNSRRAEWPPAPASKLLQIFEQRFFVGVQQRRSVIVSTVSITGMRRRRLTRAIIRVQRVIVRLIYGKSDSRRVIGRADFESCRPVLCRFQQVSERWNGSVVKIRCRRPDSLEHPRLVSEWSFRFRRVADIVAWIVAGRRGNAVHSPQFVFDLIDERGHQRNCDTGLGALVRVEQDREMVLKDRAPDRRSQHAKWRVLRLQSGKIIEERDIRAIHNGGLDDPGVGPFISDMLVFKRVGPDVLHRRAPCVLLIQEARLAGPYFMAVGAAACAGIVQIGVARVNLASFCGERFIIRP